MDAITTAIDLLYKETKARPELEKATVTKRIIIISGLLEQVHTRLLRGTVCPSRH